MDRLNRELSSREKTLLVVLALLLLFVGYFKFILTPINDGVSDYRRMASEQEDDFVVNYQKAAIVKNMQDELDRIKTAGGAKALPEYDNSSALLLQLRGILDSNLEEYNMQFGKTAEYDYLVCRPLELQFKTGSYETARRLIDQISSCPTVQQITDLDIRIESAAATSSDAADGTEVTVYMNVNYYEFKK